MTGRCLAKDELILAHVQLADDDAQAPPPLAGHRVHAVHVRNPLVCRKNGGQEATFLVFQNVTLPVREANSRILLHFLFTWFREHCAKHHFFVSKLHALYEQYIMRQRYICSLDSS